MLHQLMLTKKNLVEFIISLLITKITDTSSQVNKFFILFFIMQEFYSK